MKWRWLAALSPVGLGIALKVLTGVAWLGNPVLYLRGDAPGLSWKKGIPMDCKSAKSWCITMSGVKSVFEYKVLINDIHWETGANNVAKPEVANSTSPSF